MIVQCRRCHLRHDLTGRPRGTIVSCRCGAPLELAPQGGESVALTCPQCAGQADQNLSRCQHCDSALATIRCATCFGLAFDGNAHCPHCGSSLDSPAVVAHDSGREPLPCPSCRSDLDALVIDKTLIDGCSNCGGIWLDHTAFEKLLDNRKFAGLSANLNIPGWKTSQKQYQASEKDSLYVRCPVCEHFMHRRNYAKRSGIILDVCAAHGIWFDANELARVCSYRVVDTAQSPSMRFPTEPGVHTSSSTTTVIIGDNTGTRSFTWVDGVAALSDILVDFFD
ncbi:MAG: zf-TFIIB domain-containing protein [Gammaproteobacteria bacterium]|nr:zf-TFIIB domain-containing protein [Gammaproteobacteria bacterium]